MLVIRALKEVARDSDGSTLILSKDEIVVAERNLSGDVGVEFSSEYMYLLPDEYEVIRDDDNWYAVCFYCDKTFHGGTLTERTKLAQEHIEQCPKHPMSKLKTENERLQGFVDKYPKTADGVPVVPSMDVWIRLHGQFVQMLVTGVLIDNRLELTFHSKHRTIEQAADCYSTCEAAQVTKGKR